MCVLFTQVSRSVVNNTVCPFSVCSVILQLASWITKHAYAHN